MNPDLVELHDAGYGWRNRFPQHVVARRAEGAVVAWADDGDGAWLVTDEGALADLLDAGDRRGLVTVRRFASRDDRDAALAASLHAHPHGDSERVWSERGRLDLAGALRDAARRGFDTDGPAVPGQERAWGRRMVDALRALPQVRQVDDDVAHGELAWRWTRPPGRFDLVWSVDGQRAAAELKIRKPDELIWDVVKLADQAGFDDAPFAYAAICVQVEPSDLTRPSGPLLTGECAGEQRPFDWISRWPKDWHWLMRGGRGIRPRSLPGRVVLGEPVVIGDHGGTHWQIVSVAGTATGGERDALDAWGWPVELGLRPDGWRPPVEAEETVGRAIAPQAMVDCAGYPVPARFRPSQSVLWLAEHYPQMSEDQRRELLRLLRLRGWTEQDLGERVPVV